MMIRMVWMPVFEVDSGARAMPSIADWGVVRDDHTSMGSPDARGAINTGVDGFRSGSAAEGGVTLAGVKRAGAQGVSAVSVAALGG